MSSIQLPCAPHAVGHSKLWAEPNDIANLAKHIEPRWRARVPLRLVVYDEDMAKTKIMSSSSVEQPDQSSEPDAALCCCPTTLNPERAALWSAP